MLQAHGNTIGYLRLSITPGCAMRCVYCRPGFDRNGDRPELLTSEEIDRVVRHLVSRHGVRKVRLTGGDPTSRSDLIEIIERLAAIERIEDLAMTTHGLVLSRMATRFREAGLQRVNVSLDSLKAETFARMTGVDGMHRAMAGIDAALEAGLTPLKINTVVLRDENLDELPELLRFAADRGVAIRFIELMPMGPLAAQWSERYVTAMEMRGVLGRNVEAWEPVEQGHESATRYRATLADGRVADVGFITPMSCNFCAACNRLRLTAEGAIYPCLMDQPRGSIMPAVRPVFDAAHLDQLLNEAIAGKAPEHPAEGFAIMTHIGG